MTRTFAIGDPGEKLKEIYQIVLDVAVIDAAKPGMTGVHQMQLLEIIFQTWLRGSIWTFYRTWDRFRDPRRTKRFFSCRKAICTRKCDH